MKKVWKWLLLALCTACALCAFMACKKVDKPVPSHQHTLAHYIEREATCYKVGVKEHLECLICNKTFSSETRKEVSAKDLEIACLPHTEVEDEAVEPTCTQSGRTAGKHCSVCNTVIVKQEIIPAGHKEVVTDRAVAPTCTESGLTEGRRCSVCNTVIATQEVIPARGHKEAIDKAVVATCLDGKTEGKHCSVCGTVLIEQEAVPATERHTWKNNVCTVCDLYRYYTRGLKYELNEDKMSYSVSGIGTALGNIQIPAAYEGKPVTAIQERAFCDCKDLTGITIPDSVISIGDDTFSGCTSLESATIGSGVISIGDNAFSGCTWLESATIGSGVSSIGDYAFLSCRALQGIVIPKSVKSIGKNAFEECPHMTYITVESGNPKYYSAGNCLIEAKTKILILGCQGSVIPADGSVTAIGDSAFHGALYKPTVGSISVTSITIPDSVTSIGNYAFARCSSLREVTIGSGVTSIGNDAFFQCRDLQGITIPKSVESIGDYAFELCKNLTSIIFDGTIKEWKAIKKGSAWDEETGDYVVRCTDGKLDKDGNEIK